MIGVRVGQIGTGSAPWPIPSTYTSWPRAGKEVLRSSNRDRYFKNVCFENEWDPFLIFEAEQQLRSSQIAKVYKAWAKLGS